MKKLIATIGVVASLGIGAFALNSVMPVSAGTLDPTPASTASDSDTGCSTRTTVKDVLDNLVTDGTIPSDQESAIIDALKTARQSNRADRPGRQLHAIREAAQVAADKIGVSVDD